MNAQSMSRKEKLEFLNEILQNDPQIVKDWLASLVNKGGDTRQERIRKMIEEDFEEYEAVFKALA